MAQELPKKPALTPQRRIKLSLLSGFLFVIILGAMVYSTKENKAVRELPVSPTPVATSRGELPHETVAYNGRNGVDALTLLKERSSVEQDSTGMVIAINQRKAETSKKEFWSFFVNGKMAEVGPADYVTKDGDQIEWRIQTY